MKYYGGMLLLAETFWSGLEVDDKGIWSVWFRKWLWPFLGGTLMHLVVSNNCLLFGFVGGGLKTPRVAPKARLELLAGSRWEAVYVCADAFFSFQD